MHSMHLGGGRVPGPWKGELEILGAFQGVGSGAISGSGLMFWDVQFNKRYIGKYR